MDVFFFDSYYTRYLETLWVKIIDSVKKDDHSPNVQKILSRKAPYGTL